MATIWQMLGAFVNQTRSVDEERIIKFVRAGGRWVIVNIYNDEKAAPYNLRDLPRFRDICVQHGVWLGGWYNGRGGDAERDAGNIAQIRRDNFLHLGPTILDLEAEYKYPDGQFTLMPNLLKRLREKLPGGSIGVSSFGFADRGFIWNGRTLTPPQSLYDLGVRFLPQWYYLQDGKYDPSWCMRDLKTNAAIDGNIADTSAPNGRGIPLSYVHGTISCEESHEIAHGLDLVRRAKQFGFTTGISVYMLENLSDDDFNSLNAAKGDLFLT